MNKNICALNSQGSLLNPSDSILRPATRSQSYFNGSSRSEGNFVYHNKLEKDIFNNLIKNIFSQENLNDLKQEYQINLDSNKKIDIIKGYVVIDNDLDSKYYVSAFDELISITKIDNYKNCQILIDNYIKKDDTKIISLIKDLLSEANKDGVKGYGRLGLLEASLIDYFEKNEFYNKENKSINLTKIHNLDKFKRMYILFNYITWLLHSKDNVLYASYSNEVVNNVKADITFPDRVLSGYKEDDLVIAMKNAIKNLNPKIRYSLNLEMEMLLIGQTISVSQNLYNFSNFGKFLLSGFIQSLVQNFITYFSNKVFSVQPYYTGKVNNKIKQDKRQLVNILKNFESKNFKDSLKELPQLLDSMSKNYKNDWFNNITLDYKINGQKVRLTLTMLFSELLKKLPESNSDKVKECREKLTKLINLSYFSSEDNINVTYDDLKDVLFKINQQLYFPNVDRVKIIFLVDKFRIMLDKYSQNNNEHINDLKDIYSHIINKLLTQKIKSRTAYSGDLVNVGVISLTSMLDILSSGLVGSSNNGDVKIIVGLINAFITGIQADSADYIEEFGKPKLKTIKNTTNNTIQHLLSLNNLSYKNSILMSRKRELIKKDPQLINIFADSDIVNEILGMQTDSKPKMLETDFEESLGLSKDEIEIFSKNVNLRTKFDGLFAIKESLNDLTKLGNVDKNLSELVSNRDKIIGLIYNIYEKIDSNSYKLKQYSRMDHFNLLSSLLQKVQFNDLFITMTKENFYKLYLKLTEDEIKNLTSTISSEANIDILTKYRNNKIQIFNKIYNNLFAPGTNGSAYFETLFDIIENEKDELLQNYFRNLIKDEIQVSKNDKNSRMYGLNQADERKYLISIIATIIMTFVVTIIKIFAISALSTSMVYMIFVLLIFTVILMRDAAIYQLDIRNYNKKFQPILARLNVDLTEENQKDIDNIIKKYCESYLNNIHLLDSNEIVEKIINFLGENVSTKPLLIKKLKIVLSICADQLNSDQKKYRDLLMKLKDKLIDRSGNLGIYEIINRNDHIKSYILAKSIFEACLNSLVLCLNIFKDAIYNVIVLALSVTFLRALIILFRNKYYQAFRVRSKTNKKIGNLLDEKIKEIAITNNSIENIDEINSITPIVN